MFFHELLGRFTPLTNALAAEGIPCAAFLHYAHIAAEIDNFAVAGYAGAV